MSAATFAPPPRLTFDLPAHLEAHEPPEERGLSRDDVRMLVAERATGCLTHTTFTALPTFLDAGDLIVINTSAVIPAAITTVAGDGTALVLHLSTMLDDSRWVVELRRITNGGPERWTGAVPTSRELGADARVSLDERCLGSDRLWIARLDLPQPVFTWLAEHGEPIRYGYVHRA